MFLIILFITIIISLVFPQPGNIMHQMGFISPLCIFIMYFALGFFAEFKSIKLALKKIKTTIVIQIAIFVIAPLIALLLYSIFSQFVDSKSIIGILFIGAVPTTMTSCIMLTRQYGGDDILALCNAMLSQILGVIITPLILLFFLQSNYINVASFSSVINKLFVQVMIPFIMGQILSQFYNSDKIIQIAKKITFYGIFPLIYISVAQVVAKGNFKNILLNGYYPIIICILFAIFQILVTQLLGKGFNFSRKEKITLLFTAAQKTMGLGIPLVLMYFPNNSEYSTNIIFMFLIYYILSLLIVSSYAKFLNK